MSPHQIKNRYGPNIPFHRFNVLKFVTDVKSRFSFQLVCLCLFSLAFSLCVQSIYKVMACKINILIILHWDYLRLLVVRLNSMALAFALGI